MWKKFKHVQQSQRYQDVAPMLYGALFTLGTMALTLLVPQGVTEYYDHRVTVVFAGLIMLCGGAGIMAVNSLMNNMAELIHSPGNKFLPAPPNYAQSWLRYVHEARHALLTLILYCGFLASLAGSYLAYEYKIAVGAPLYLILYTLLLYFIFASLLYYGRVLDTYQKIIGGRGTPDAGAPPPIYKPINRYDSVQFLLAVKAARGN